MWVIEREELKGSEFRPSRPLRFRWFWVANIDDLLRQFFGNPNVLTNRIRNTKTGEIGYEYGSSLNRGKE